VAIVNTEPIEIIRGDGNDLTITFYTDDTKATLLPWSTTFKLWFTVKRRDTDSDADAICQLSTDATTITIANLATSTIVTIPASATTGLAGGTVLVYDVQLKKPSQDPKTMAIGTLKVVADVTRATG